MATDIAPPGRWIVKPRPFDYLAPGSVDEVLDTLAELGEEAKLLAGGQSLGAMLNLRLAEPELLIHVGGLDELSYLRETDGFLEVGAATTQSQLMAWPGLAERAPLLAVALPHLGHFQTRAQGTVGGSLSHADPSSELPLCLATLGGEVVLKSKRGERTLAAADFQQGMLSTARAEDELLTQVRFPLVRPDSGYAFSEIARRRGDFAVVDVAAVVGPDGIRIGVGGVADRPAVCEWGMLDGDALDDALNEFAWELGGDDDIHASAQYRRQLVRRLGRRTIEEAASWRD